MSRCAATANVMRQRPHDTSQRCEVDVLSWLKTIAAIVSTHNHILKIYLKYYLLRSTNETKPPKVYLILSLNFVALSTDLSLLVLYFRPGGSKYQHSPYIDHINSLHGNLNLEPFGDPVSGSGQSLQRQLKCLEHDICKSAHLNKQTHKQPK